MAAYPWSAKRPTSGVLAAGLLSPVTILVQADDKLASRQSFVEVGEYIGITRRHWIDRNSRIVCKNRSCRFKFTLINGSKNCSRCGDVFCKKCLAQSRRLNICANYDPQGKFYKVCEQCFNSERQSSGTKRSRMKEFRSFRTASHSRKNELCRSEWASAEERIVSGFLIEVNSTPSLVRIVQSLTINFIKGAWKKPIRSVSSDVMCWHCTKKFEMLFRARHQCSICGAAVCESCSNKDLIVYIQDEHTQADCAEYVEARLGLIRIQGGPSVEPEVHEYLRICTPCHTTKQSRQVQDIVDGKKHQDQSEFWSRLCDYHDKLSTDQREIEASLVKYEQLTRSLEDGSQRTSCGTSNAQVLSKAQIDLSDLFYEYLKSAAKLKSVKPITKNTETLLKNLMKSTNKFYMENKSLFTELKGSLAEYLPIEVIETIQNQVNKKTLICVHLLVKQLGLEVLSLADRQLGAKAMDIAQHLADAEEAIADDLKSVLHKLEGEESSWDGYIKTSNELTKVSLKERRLIRCTSLASSQPDYLLNEMIERSCDVLDQISMQLTAKTTQNSYKRVKDRILQVKKTIFDLVCSTS